MRAAALAVAVAAAICAVLASTVAADKDGKYLIGAGIYDVTGPAADVNFMGYAAPGQVGRGIQMRLRARAFVIADPGAGGKRVVFVNVDCAMVSQIMKIEVTQKLAKAFPNGEYDHSNVLLSAIHTHSGPGAFLQYVLFDITSLGFQRQSLDALTDGIVEAIKMAHANMKSGSITTARNEILDASANRSPTAYLFNPAEERANYKHDTDKQNVMLKFVADDGQPIGLIDWFAVHCTSFNNTNQLITSDNKGYAAYRMEKEVNPEGTQPGQGPFVAAFAQSNEGDVSPNTAGARCIDSGLPCDPITSTCHGKNELCIASGPGKDMQDSARIIGERQFEATLELFHSPHAEAIQGPVDFRHTFKDMTNVTVSYGNETGSTCPPAMGFAFASGTTDGPGMFNFHQSDTKGNKFWEVVSGFIAKPTPAAINCHHPKPILLDTGGAHKPYAWQPSIVDLQILRIGNFIIVGVPGEFTTMSGRRLRDAVQKVLVDAGVMTDANAHVVIAGLSNTYADYIATYEEYQEQRYEGASTIFGPHTLAAYIQGFQSLAQDMALGRPSSTGPSPPNLLTQQLDFLPGVVADEVPIGKKFGEVVIDVAKSYKAGETASAQFYSGCPRNDLMTQKTFLNVERKEADGTWKAVLSDGDWETKFKWQRHEVISPVSYATIEWDIPLGTPDGTYRLCHFGHYKELISRKVLPLQGTSSEFVVTNA